MKKYNVNNLTPFKSKWNNKPTKLVRIPEVLTEQVLGYAHELDNNKKNNSSLLQVKLEGLLMKVNAKEKGYKSNSASKLINELKQLLE